MKALRSLKVVFCGAELGFIFMSPVLPFAYGFFGKYLSYAFVCAMAMAFIMSIEETVRRRLETPSILFYGGFAAAALPIALVLPGEPSDISLVAFSAASLIGTCLGLAFPKRYFLNLQSA